MQTASAQARDLEIAQLSTNWWQYQVLYRQPGSGKDLESANLEGGRERSCLIAPSWSVPQGVQRRNSKWLTEACTSTIWFAVLLATLPFVEVLVASFGREIP